MRDELATRGLKFEFKCRASGLKVQDRYAGIAGRPAGNELTTGACKDFPGKS